MAPHDYYSTRRMTKDEQDGLMLLVGVLENRVAEAAPLGRLIRGALAMCFLGGGLLGLLLLVILSVLGCQFGMSLAVAVWAWLGIIVLGSPVVAILLRSGQRQQSDSAARLLQEAQGTVKEGVIEYARFRPTEVLIIVGPRTRLSSGPDGRSAAEDSWTFLFRLDEGTGLIITRESSTEPAWPNTSFEVTRLPRSKHIISVKEDGTLLSDMKKLRSDSILKGRTEGEPFELDWDSLANDIGD